MKLTDIIHVLCDKNMLGCEIVGDFDMEATSNWFGYLSETPWYLAEQEISRVEISKPDNEAHFADLYIELKGNEIIYDRVE